MGDHSCDLNGATPASTYTCKSDGCATDNYDGAGGFLEQCCGLCRRSEKKCKGWSAGISSNTKATCWLKSSLTGKTFVPASKSGMRKTSGIATCKPAFDATTSTCDYKENTDFTTKSGFLLPEIQATDQAACCAACANYAHCSAAVFYKT